MTWTCGPGCPVWATFEGIQCREPDDVCAFDVMELEELALEAEGAATLKADLAKRYRAALAARKAAEEPVPVCRRCGEPVQRLGAPGSGSIQWRCPKCRVLYDYNETLPYAPWKPSKAEEEGAK